MAIKKKRIKPILGAKARRTGASSTLKGSEILIHATSGKIRCPVYKCEVSHAIGMGDSLPDKKHSIKKHNGHKRLYEQEMRDINRAALTLEKYRID